MPEKLSKILQQEFGTEEGNRILEESRKNYESLLPMAEGETKGRKKNMVGNIFPFAAIYRTLLNRGMTKDTAMSHMFSIMEVNTRTGMRKTYETMGKLPFFFKMFRTMFSQGLKGDSWTVEWISNDKENFEYNIKTCLWHEVCTELGYPELCRIFCRNDEINFIDVSPRLHFERSQTLGEGGTCCDFHFYRHEHHA